MKTKRCFLSIAISVLFVTLACSSSFAKTYYLIKKDGTKINIEKLLPDYSAAHPIPIEIYIPTFWGGKYKEFNEKYGKHYGRKVLGGYDYTSAAILSVMYGGIKVVDKKGRSVNFLPETVRESLFYAVATPTKVNNVLFEVIRDYIVNDTKEGPQDNSLSVSAAGAMR